MREPAIKCMIIEDEPMARKILAKYIHQVHDLLIVFEAESADHALEYLKGNSVDLLFLDINLPGTDGVKFYRSLINAPKVILTTAYQEFALDGFEINAIDFLLKPFSFERFLKAVNNYFRENQRVEIQENADAVFFKSNKRIYRVAYDSILFVEGLGDYVCVQTSDKKIVVHEKMRDMEHRLHSFGFERIHKSFIINSLHVDYIEGNQINVKGKLLPIGKAYRQNVLSHDENH
jgi:DNA-binding LytR/AlgR family response regulator